MAKGKAAKKNIVESNHRKIEDSYSSSIGISSGVRVIIFVLVLLAVFYLLTLYITNKKSPLKVVSNASIQYSEILAGEVFNQKDSKYVVLFYDKSNEDSSKYLEKISDYREKDSSMRVYTVNLREGLNKNYVDSEQENREVSDISNLKVKGDTLIHIENGKVLEYITENIEEFFNNN